MSKYFLGIQKIACIGKSLTIASVIGTLHCQFEERKTSYLGPSNGCAQCDEASCLQGICTQQKTNYDFELEVTSPSPSMHGLTIRVPVADRTGGQRDLVLPKATEVRVRLQTTPPIPIELRLARKEWIPGSLPSIFEGVSSVNDGAFWATTFVPPELKYELSITPNTIAAKRLFPPFFLGERDISASNQELIVAPTGMFKTFQVQLLDARRNPITSAKFGRDLWVIDAQSGQLLSTVVSTCESPSQATLKLSPDNPNINPLTRRTLLRIGLPNCAEATANLRVYSPTLDVDLQALDVEGTGSGSILIPDEISPITVLVDISAVGTNGNKKLASTVIFKSIKLDIEDSNRFGLAHYETQLNAEGGIRTMSILPGDYDVTVVPAAGLPYALTRVQKSIRATSGGPGFVQLPIEINPKTRAMGCIVAPDAASTTCDKLDLLRDVFSLGNIEITPEQSASVDSTLVRSASFPFGTSAFTLQGLPKLFGTVLDPGSYHIVAKVPELSGYPWAIRLSVPIEPPTSDKPLDMGKIHSSIPVLFFGQVTNREYGLLPHTLIRARALLKDASCRATGSVLIGETRADSQGNYRLLLPNTIAQPCVL